MILKTPWVLILIPVIVPLMIWRDRTTRPPSVRFPSRHLVRPLPRSWKTRMTEIPFVLRVLTVMLFIVALAGPRSVLEETQYHFEGIDIMLALDASRSMATEDFSLLGKRYNRLAISKKVVEEFVDGRQHDRIGLVVFAGLAYTVCPLTKDYVWLKENLKRIEFDLIKDGTAIGSATSTALIRLTESDARSKVIVLLTDGVNNAGTVDPVEAAHASQAYGVRIYTIGAGTKGYAPYPVEDIFGRTRYQKVITDVDENTLREMARVSGGKYFRATDTASLRQIYKEIDQMEKTPFEETGYRDYKELFPYVLAMALVLFMIELFLSHTVLLRIP
ncbi:MAG: VWA domain-containing protein [Candidatus Omnitrophota bacterium]|jgi:Ca-activated chloride channel family protein